MSRTPMNAQTQRNYKDYVIYQIYTRSFNDSNGDGIGDIAGIIQKLDYLENLGVDVLWLSPFCSSPNRDNGYDVSDYRNVMKEFGTLKDLDRLIEKAHQRGMLIMMDLVMNHSSIEHPWFTEKPEYYYWTDSPNNWDSYFSNSAWTWDGERRQYYLHLFYPEQPDLNWENPELRKEFHDIAAFWIDRGIDAFRLDAIHHIGKPEGLPDAPEPKNDFEHRNFKNTRRTHEYLREFREKGLNNGSVFTVGETGGTTPRTSRNYVDTKRKELDMIFLFDHLWKLKDDIRNLPEVFKPIYRHLHKDGWNTNFFSNHDFPRHLSIVGNDGLYHRESATSFAALLLTLWGTPFIYQGEEIGMTNVAFSKLRDYDCEAAKNRYYRALEEGISEEQAFTMFRQRTRDNARTPFQWSSAKHGGFTSGIPWLKVNPNHGSINAAAQMGRPGSIFENYRFLIHLRKRWEVLARGKIRFLPQGRDRVLAWKRFLGRKERREAGSYSGPDELILISNPGDHSALWKRPSGLGRNYRLIYSNAHRELMLGSDNSRPAASREAEIDVLSHQGAGEYAGEQLGSTIILGPWETRLYVRL